MAPPNADSRDPSDPASLSSGGPSPARGSPAPSVAGYTWPARLILAGYFALIGVFSPVYGPFGKGAPPPALELEDYLQGTEWIIRPVFHAASDAGQLFLVGLLIPMSLPRQPAGSGPRVRRTLVVLLALLLAAVFQLARSGFPPSPLRLAVPVCGCLAGAWVGLGILRGWRAALKRSLVLGVLGVLLVVGGAGLVQIMLDRQPLPLEAETVTAAERERIEQVLRASGPAAGGPRRIDLTPKDANLLLGIALASVAKEHKVKLAMAENTVAVEASLKLPTHSGGSRYLNARGLCRLEIERGDLALDLRRLRIGRLDVPAWLLPCCSRGLRSAILDDPELRELVLAVESLRVGPEGVGAVFRRGRFQEKLLPSLIARLNGKPDVLAATRAHFRRLAVTARAWPSGKAQVTVFLQTAFTLARERSRQGDPVLENRAAILALAVLLGHPRLEQLIGPVVGDDLRPIARQYTGRVPLRGRRDWTQHFFVSAASALLANEAIGNRIGLLKEELDATAGGSGFSFSDLLADRAGVSFAVAATRDEASARAMQERIAGDFRIDDVFPPAADLPEGIAESVLKAEYGGIGGAGYRRMVEEIERRLRECPALR